MRPSRASPATTTVALLTSRAPPADRVVMGEELRSYVNVLLGLSTASKDFSVGLLLVVAVRHVHPDVTVL